MYIVYVIWFHFFFAFLHLQSIRDDEATTSKVFNVLSDVPITSLKTLVEVANSGKTMRFYESIQVVLKISENSRFQSFELPTIRKIPAVPGTSNNRGLTVDKTTLGLKDR